MNIDDIPHVSFDWAGGNYGVPQALLDTLTSSSFWQTVLVIALLCVIVTIFWARKGEDVLDRFSDDSTSGAQRMDERVVSWLPKMRTLIPAGFSLVFVLVGFTVIYGTFTSTLAAGTDFEFRKAGQDALRSESVYVNTGDVPSAFHESKTGIVARSQSSSAAGRSCTIVNLDANQARAHQHYRLAVICDGQPLRMG